MPDAGGNIKGIALTGKAGETLERIKQAAQYCPDRPECQTCPASYEDDVCLDHERLAYLDECSIDD